MLGVRVLVLPRVHGVLEAESVNSLSDEGQEGSAGSCPLQKKERQVLDRTEVSARFTRG